MASFMAGDTLVIEFPLKEEELTLAGVGPVELLPKILDNSDGTQSVQMNFQVPESVDPSNQNTTISTGHWGCGAFRGNKELKALIQLVAASLSKNNLLFYCHADVKFYEKFSILLNKIYGKNIKLNSLWEMILNLQHDLINLKNESVCEYLIHKIDD